MEAQSEWSTCQALPYGCHNCKGSGCGLCPVGPNSGLSQYCLHLTPCKDLRERQIGKGRNGTGLGPTSLQLRGCIHTPRGNSSRSSWALEGLRGSLDLYAQFPEH